MMDHAERRDRGGGELAEIGECPDEGVDEIGGGVLGGCGGGGGEEQGEEERIGEDAARP